MILDVAANLHSWEEAMSLLNLEEMCARRWPYVVFVLVSASLFLACALLFRSDPFYIGRICIFMFVGEWSGALKGRIKAAGLRPSRWLRFLYGLVVIGSCTLVFFLTPIGRFLTPGLFVVLNLPLALIGQKPSGVDAATES
jgi:hypothetical protein